MKRMLLAFLALVLVCVVAQAEEVVIDGIRYTVNTSSKNATVYGINSGEDYEGEIVIPPSIVVDGEVCAVTSIDMYAFFGYTGLTSVTIPDGVLSIGNNAFEGCSGLTFISFPSSLQTIGLRTFARCTSLTSVEVSCFLGENAFLDCTGLTSVTISKGATGLGGAFTGCSNLTSVTFSEGVTGIAKSTFSECI